MTSGTGTCSVEAIWPLDTVYTQETVKASVKATKLTPAIAWTPTAITYGTALGSDQLNAVATGYNGAAFTGGTYKYNLATGKILGAGTPQLSVKFTPSSTDALDYTDATDAAALSVSQAATTTNINSPTPTTAKAGKPVKVTVEVTVPGSGKLTGGITVSADTGENCSITKPSATGTGSCSLTIATTDTGTRTLTAVYAGDANTQTSTSAGFTLIVN
jgi:hypothetical protein